jgi:hypothetical protein
MLKKIKKIHLKLAINLLLVVIVVLAAGLAANIFKKKILDISEQVIMKKELSSSLKNRGATNALIKEDFKKIDPGLEKKLDDAIPKIDNVIPFIDIVESLAKKHSLEHNLRLSSPEILPKIGGKLPLDTFEFNLALNDVNLDSLIKFLSDLEKLPYFASIKSINLSGQNNGGWANNSQVTLVGKLYVSE